MEWVGATHVTWHKKGIVEAYRAEGISWAKGSVCFGLKSALPTFSPPLPYGVRVSKQNMHGTFDPLSNLTPVFYVPLRRYDRIHFFLFPGGDMNIPTSCRLCSSDNLTNIAKTCAQKTVNSLKRALNGPKVLGNTLRHHVDIKNLLSVDQPYFDW